MSDNLPNIGEISYLEIDGLQIRIARGGADEGVPVVLTSPWPESIYAFRDILPEFSSKAPYIAIDLPGFGLSEGRADLMAPKAMAGFIVKAAELLGITKMHGVGPDIGALAFLFAASERPDLFASLIVGSGATSVDLAAGGLVDLIASKPGAYAGMEGGDLGTGFITSAAARPTPPAVLDDYRKSSAGTRFEDATNFVRAYNGELPVLKALLPTIETPVLVLAGHQDPLVPPSNGKLLEDLLPRGHQVLLEGGHLIWEDAANEYGTRIADWIGGGFHDA